jgi:hypothetical protein
LPNLDKNSLTHASSSSSLWDWMPAASDLDGAVAGRAGEGRAAQQPVLRGAGAQPSSGREGAGAGPGRGGHGGWPLEERLRLRDRQWEGRARWLAFGGASARPAMGQWGHATGQGRGGLTGSAASQGRGRRGVLPGERRERRLVVVRRRRGRVVLVQRRWGIGLADKDRRALLCSHHTGV